MEDLGINIDNEAEEADKIALASRVEGLQQRGVQYGWALMKFALFSDLHLKSSVECFHLGNLNSWPSKPNVFQIDLIQFNYRHRECSPFFVHLAPWRTWVQFTVPTVPCNLSSMESDSLYWPPEHTDMQIMVELSDHELKLTVYQMLN
ncbi:hypothetical protein STEG23_032648 [Scotinomys teguina]